MIKKITPLRISIQTDSRIGTGRYNSLEQVPLTSYALKYYLQTDAVNHVLAKLCKASEPIHTPCTLRDYQAEDVNYLMRYNSMGCFNEQRTGKTPTSLSVFKLRGLTKVLVVCPASGIYKWQEEFEKWYDAPCLVATGTPTQRIAAYNNWTHGLVISYDTLKETARKQSDLSYILKHKIEGVIVDEIHRIKNRKTKQTEAVFKLAKVPHKLALTGTLATNKPEDIYPTLHFLYPTLFTSYWRLVDYYFNVGSKQFYKNGRLQEARVIGKLKNPSELHEFLNNISTQRKRKEVMSWLPDVDIENIRLPMTKEQTKYIKDLEDHYETEDVMVQGDLDRLIRYRQICQDPQLIGLKGKAPKTEWLQQYIEDYPEESILIFSKFAQYLKRLYTVLPNSGIITGDIPQKNREKLIKDFQNETLKVLLLQIDTAKEGITLDTATTAIFLDVFPPAGSVSQAKDRFIATSKAKADKKHLIINVMMKDSYDEYLFHSVEQNIEELSIINNYKKFMKGELIWQ